MSETSTCRHCGRPILRPTQAEIDFYSDLYPDLPEERRPVWTHVVPGHASARTCRAASYDPRRRDALGPLPWDPRFDRRHSPAAEPVQE